MINNNNNSHNNHIIIFKDHKYNINLRKTNLFHLIKLNLKPYSDKCEIQIEDRKYSFKVKEEINPDGFQIYYEEKNLFLIAPFFIYFQKKNKKTRQCIYSFEGLVDIIKNSRFKKSYIRDKDKKIYINMESITKDILKIIQVGEDKTIYDEENSPNGKYILNKTEFEKNKLMKLPCENDKYR